MNIELNNTTLLLLLLAIVVIYLYVFRTNDNNEHWTLLAGAQQNWEKLQREENICDTGFSDEECKYSAINCLKNPNSEFYMNE